jgi:hypothetical protein
MRYLALVALLGASTAQARDRIEFEGGFPMFRASWHRALSDRASLGGAVGFDYAYFAPEDAFGAAVLAAVPLRYTLAEEVKWEARVRFEPGLYFGVDQPKFSQFILGVLMNAGASVAWWTHRSFLVGGGIDLPIVFGAPTGGRDVFVAVPVLLGPVAEWHASDRLVVTADLKLGPHFMSDDYFGTRLGFRMLFGASYAL